MIITIHIDYIIICQNQYMRNEARQSFSSTGSHRAESALHWLVHQMGLTDRQAKLLFFGNGGNNKVDILNMFVKNDGMYSHLYCPRSDLCEICGEGPESHSYIFNQRHESVLEKLESNRYSGVEDIDDLIEHSPMVQCAICDGQYYESDIATIQGKLHNICNECFGAYLREEILNAKVLDMKCPHCSLVLDSKTIALFVDVLTYKNDKQMMKNPDLRWCPNPRCGKIVNIKSKSGKNAKCLCGTEICTKCNRQGHGKMSCKQMFDKETKQWEDVIDVQNCKKCHSLVEKVSGCNHMTCQVCKYQWCWLCKSTYSSIHFNSLNPFGCPGLQNGDHLSRNWGCFRRSMYRFGLLLLFIIIIPIALPIAMLIAGPTLAIIFVKDRDFYWQLSNCERFPIIVVCILVGLIFDPIAWVGLLIYFIPIGISALIDYYRSIKQMEDASTNRLHQKLIQQANFDDPVVQ